MNQKELVAFSSKLLELAVAGKFQELDQLLSDMDEKTISPEQMLASIRVTYPIRSELPAWYYLNTRIYHELATRQLDAPRLMQGLLDELKKEID